MKHILILFGSVVTLFFASTDEAQAKLRSGAVSYGEKLIFSQTLAGNPSERESSSLCYLVSYADVIALPIYMSPKAYVLSRNNCEGTEYTPVSPEMFQVLQLGGVVPTSLPVKPRLPLKWKIFGHAIPLLLGSLFILRITTRKLRMETSKPRSSALIVNMLAAMSAVAVSDGEIGESEVCHISTQISALTGRDIDDNKVRELLSHTKQYGPDWDTIGVGLCGSEKYLVMQAALTTLVVDRKIDDAEYDIVSRIAQKLEITGGEFMMALHRAKVDMSIA